MTSLFDDIGELADKDPDADCREVVMARAKELGIDNIEFTDEKYSMKRDGKLGMKALTKIQLIKKLLVVIKQDRQMRPQVKNAVWQ